MQQDKTDSLFQAVETHFSYHPTWIVQLRWSTAVGKTALSIDLAQRFNAEIISADSRQVYRWMDIGTGKVTIDEMQWVPHHQIDIVDPNETYTAGQWKHDTLKLIGKIHGRGKRVIIIWWTGLYHDTLYKNYAMPEVTPNPEWRAMMMERERQESWALFALLQQQDLEESYRHHPNSLRYIVRALEIIHFTWRSKTEQSQQLPVQFPTLLWWLRRSKDDTNKRINMRVKQMIDEWLVEEVEKLIHRWYGREHNAMNGIGYIEILNYLEWAISLEKAIERIKRHSHKYAKRQRTRRRRYMTDATMNPKADVTYWRTVFSE